MFDLVRVNVISWYENEDLGLKAKSKNEWGF